MRRLGTLFMFLAASLAVRAATISGRIVDPSGEVLPGVSVETQNRTRMSDIDYFYTSRLPREPAGGVSDIHTHPIEPRAFRVRVETTF